MDLQFFLSSSLSFFLKFLTTWWWVFLPFILYPLFKFLWIYWRQEVFDLKEPRILLEIRMPQIVDKPLMAMENVFAGFWQMYDPPNPREFWFEGQYQMSFSLEVASTEGTVRFYLYIPRGSRQIMEAALYSQYPDAELVEAEDYIKQVPQNVPNKDWRMWGASYTLNNPSPYPLKTYSKFFEANPDTREEKRVDPVSVLVEGLSKIGEGEHLWVHFLCVPFSPRDPGQTFVQDGWDLVDQLAHRVSGEGKPTISAWEDIKATGSMMTTGEETERKMSGMVEEQGLIAPELRLTPGERDIISAIEEKISKPAFFTYLRFVYLAKTDKYFGPAKALPMSYFNQYSTTTMNYLRPYETVKVHTVATSFLDARRGYLRRRKLLRALLYRIPPYFPQSYDGSFVLNIEEMASLFHFPSKATYPSVIVPRVDAKKGEAPAELPSE